MTTVAIVLARATDCRDDEVASLVAIARSMPDVESVWVAIDDDDAGAERLPIVPGTMTRPNPTRVIPCGPELNMSDALGHVLAAAESSGRKPTHVISVHSTRLQGDDRSIGEVA